MRKKIDYITQSVIPFTLVIAIFCILPYLSLLRRHPATNGFTSIDSTASTTFDDSDFKSTTWEMSSSIPLFLGLRIVEFITGGHPNVLLWNIVLHATNSVLLFTIMSKVFKLRIMPAPYGNTNYPRIVR